MTPPGPESCSATRTGLRRSLISVHVAVALFGAAGLFARIIDWPSPALVLARVSIAALGLTTVLLVVERGRLWRVIRPAPGWLRLPLLGLLLAVHWVTFFHAIQVSSVAVGLLAFASFPIFTALLEPLAPGGSALDRTTLTATVIVTLGIALIVPDIDPADPVTRGVFWGVVSGLTFALLSLGNRALVSRWGPLRLALHQNLWAAVALTLGITVALMAAPIAAPFSAPGLAVGATSARMPLLPPHAPPPTEWAAVILLGLVFTAGAHALFIAGLRRVTASRAAVIATLEPVYGIMLAALWLGERPGLRVLTGGTLVLAAALWVTRRSAKA